MIVVFTVVVVVNKPAAVPDFSFLARSYGLLDEGVGVDLDFVHSAKDALFEMVFVIFALLS